MGKNKAFSKEFKEGAMKLVTEEGLTYGQASSDLGIAQITLKKWLQSYRKENSLESSGVITLDEKAELLRLRKEVHTLRMERDILKKATAILSQNQLSGAR